MRHAVRDGGVDGVFGNVAPHPKVVMLRRVFGQAATLQFHFVRGLPTAHHVFAYTPHGLAVGAEDADGAQVVQNIFGGNGFFADTAFSKG